MLAEQDKELSLKEEQMRKAKKEVATMRENLEKVAKELVGRNKERDAEIQRRQHQYEMEARRMGDELSSLIQDKRELTRVEIEQKDEILMLKAQLDKAQLTHAELVQEVSSGRNQLTLKEKADEINQREINDALQQLDAMKQENNNLHLMMERLNEQLRRASEDITRSQEQMNRLRDQITEQEDEMTQTHHDRAAFAAKLVRASEAATEETKRIVEEVDSFRVMAREAAIQHAPAESRDLEMELLREQNRERAEKTEQAAKAARHHGDEQAAVMLLTRLREDLVLAWEDLRVVRSDIADEISRYNDLHAQHLALKEAYIVDREHLATLTTNLNEANVAFSKLQKEKQAMHQALAKEDEWMQECMKMSAEREANQAALRQENAVLQDQLTRLKEVAGSAEIDQRLSAVRYENERLTAETWEARRRRSEAEDALVAAQDDLAQARRDIDLMRKSQALNQTDDASSRGRLIELETEVDVLKKINDELQAKLDRSKQREHAAEAENKQLRDERFELRHKLDDLQSRTTAAESSDGHRQRMIAQQLQDDQHSISHLRSSRDDADRRAIRLEEERAHLTGHLNHLKSETAALAQGMRDASVENDQLKQIAGITPARNRGGASPVSPTMSNPGGPGGAYPRPSSPYDKALSQQDEALRDIQNRVSSLVNAMAWGR
ncbi:hypothetical protein DIPPA_15420 [Diplonema papillatum]|nr:hypothetical protein DIPPA_15420 [Diplonema papillatum]